MSDQTSIEWGVLITLPKRGDVIAYNLADGGDELPVQVETDPVPVQHRHEMGGPLHNCHDMKVRYLADHSTGELGSVHTWAICTGEEHLYTKVRLVV